MSNVLTEEDQQALEELKEEMGAEIYHLEDFRNPNITYKEILEFPMEIFPKEIREFGEAVADSVRAPIDFFATAVLGTASTLIGKQYILYPKSDKAILASIWNFSVGKSGTGKSDMQRKGVSPVLELQKRYKQEYDQAIKEYKEALKDGEENLEEPVLKQVIASNATIEALKDLLEEGPIMLYVDELAGWIKSMGQYKKGNSGESEEFLSIADNVPLIVNRKGLRQQINDPYMSVVGGIQPSKLDQIISLNLISDDGFLERFLPCFPNEMPADYNPEGADPIYEKRYIEYMSRLLKLNIGEIPKNIGFVQEAKNMFDGYMAFNANEINNDDFDERLESFWRKTFKNLSRLILIIHAIYVASGEVEESRVTKATVEAGIKLMDYFKSHFAKMVRYSLGSVEEKKYQEICDYIVKQGGTINVTKVAGRKTWGNSQEVRDLLMELQVAGLGRFIGGKAKPMDFELFTK